MHSGETTHDETPEPHRLTDEQRELAAKNVRLIYYTLTRRGLRNFVAAVGGRDEAYGVVAEAYLRAIATWQPERAALSTHVYWCSRNALSNAAERRRRDAMHRERLAGSRHAQECDRIRLTGRDERAGVVSAEQLADALRRLEPRDREVLTLRYVERLQVREIATRLGISKSRVGDLLPRAEAALAAWCGVAVPNNAGLRMPRTNRRSDDVA